MEISSIVKKNLLLESEKQGKGEGAGCLMLNFDKKIKNWNNILGIIDPADIYNDETQSFGYENDPHVTILYGFTKEVNAEQIKELFKDVNNNISVELTGIEIFSGEESNKPYDVVKFSVESSELRELHELCKQNLPNKVTFPDYKPHMTIAYVKVGNGKKYIKQFEKPIFIEGNKMVYSTADKFKTEWKLKRKYNYEISLNEEINYTDESFTEYSDYKNGIWYHGRTVDSPVFSLDYVGLEGAIDQNGSGFYFTNQLEEALRYTGQSGVVLKCKLGTKKNRIITPNTRTNPSIVNYLLKSAPDLEMTLTDWDENPRKAFMNAYTNFSRYPKAVDSYRGVEWDFYRRDGKDYCANMSKYYDGLLLDQGVSFHLILYNPNIIEVIDKKQV